MTISAEAEIDIFNMILSLKTEFGRLADSVEKQTEMERLASIAETPRFIRIHGQVTTDANGNGQLEFDNTGPDQGYYWSLRRLLVSRTAVTSTSIGTADVYVSASNVNPPGSLDWVDHAQVIPLFADYGDNEVVCRFNEQLIVTFTGANPNTQYIASGFIVQYQEAASHQAWSK